MIDVEEEESWCDEAGNPLCDSGNCKAPWGARDITNCVYCGKELIQRGLAWYTWDAPPDGGRAQDYVSVGDD